MYGDFDTLQRALRLGVYDFLLKPVDEPSLIEMLERIEPKLIQRRDAISADQFHVQVAQYVTRHLGDDDLSLTKLADKFHFSTNYLCTWFKINMGENFLRYVTRLRMEEACKLLQEGKRVYETAYAVGYKDPKYFVKVFKQSFGITPDMFRHFQGDDT